MGRQHYACLVGVFCARRRSSSNVEHPFVVNVMKVFHTDKKVYILMEFVNGGEMFRLIHGRASATSGS